jgi:hypothetical protein
MATTLTGIVTKLAFHDTVLALGLACVAGVLALVAVALVSPEAQKTVRLLIRYRAEHKLASAEAFEIKQRIVAATCGKRWRRGEADQIRLTASIYPRTVLITQIMKINRQTASSQLPASTDPPSNGSPPTPNGPEPLWVVPNDISSAAGQADGRLEVHTSYPPKPVVTSR